MEARTQVILYTKPGCHLCDQMKEQILKADCDDLYSLQEVNIEGEPALLSRYRDDIPVVSINGVEAFRHHLKSDDFKVYLERL